MLDRMLDESTPVVVRRHITLLTTARLCSNACYRFAPPFLAMIARGVGISLEQIGIALAIAELSGLLSPVTARIVDMLHRRNAMTIGLFGVATGTTLAATSHGLVWFTVALVVLSQSKVMFDLGLGSWIADHVEYDRRGRVVGLTETSWALGLLIGVSVMGLVTAAAGWRLGYLTGAAIVALAALRVMRSLPDDHHTADPTSRAERAADPSAGLSGRVWVVVLGGWSLMAASQSLFVTFGSWLEDSFSFTAAGISAVVFGLGLGELTASMTSSRRTDVWGKERSAAMGAALMVPASLGLAVWHDHLVIGLVLLAIAVSGFEFAIVSTLAIGSKLVPGSPARGLALMIGAGTLGRAMASVPATRLYDSNGMAPPALMCAVGASVAAITMMTAGRTG